MMGRHIDVQGRLSRAGETQMFFGINTPDGMALHEVEVDSHPGESIARVLAWGLGQARQLTATDGGPAIRKSASLK